MKNLLSIEQMILKEAEREALSQAKEHLEIFYQVLQTMTEPGRNNRIGIKGCTDNDELKMNVFFEKAKRVYLQMKAEAIYDDMVLKLLEKVLPENFGPENFE